MMHSYKNSNIIEYLNIYMSGQQYVIQMSWIGLHPNKRIQANNHSVKQDNYIQIPTQTAGTKKFTLLLMLMSIVFVIHEQFLYEEVGLFYELQKIPKYEQFINGVQGLYAKQNVRYLKIVYDPPKEITIKNKEKFDYSLSKSDQFLDQLNARIQGESDWIHWQDPSPLFKKILKNQNLQRINASATKGVTFIWNSKSKFYSQWVDYKDQIVRQFNKVGLHYQEILSLNLRSPTGKLLVIFKHSQEIKESNKKLKTPTKNFLALQTVFRMEQNVLFLRQWVGYHINLGVDKFFIYDNSETTGNWNRARKNQTKYGIGIQCFGYSGSDDEKMVAQFNQFWRDYSNHIIYIPWQPRNEKNQIFYGQMQALYHFDYYFTDAIEWIGQIDVDEFIFSPDNLSLEDFIRVKNKQGNSILVMMQHKFANRLCYSQKRVTDIVQSYDFTTARWAPKKIAKTSAFVPASSIHNINYKFGYQYLCPKNQFRFNHYNSFEGHVGYTIQHGYAKQVVIEADKSMVRYSQVMDTVCEGQSCSEKFVFGCSRQNMHCISVGSTYPKK